MTLVQPPGRHEPALDPERVRTAVPMNRSKTDRAACLLTLLGCVAVLVVLYVVAVRTGVGQQVDNAAVLHHHLDRTPEADVASADRILLAATILLAPVVIWCGGRNRRRLIVNGGAVAVAVLLAEMLREMLHRPSLGRFDPLYGASFPSGHSAAAMALALAVVALADGSWVRRLVPLVPGAVAAIALAVPIHRPSDLIAGFAVALGTMTAVRWIVRDDSALLPRPPEPTRLWRAALARSVCLTAALLAAEALALRRADLTLSDLGPGFPIAVLAVVGGAELTIITFRAATTRRDRGSFGDQARLVDGSRGRAQSSL